MPWKEVTMPFKLRVLALGLVFKVIMPFIALLTKLMPWKEVAMLFKVRILALGLVF